MFRWWRMVANQPTWCTTSSGLQAAARIRSSAAGTSLRTAHLLGPVLLQEGLGGPGPVGPAGDEYAELVVRETRVVRDGALPAGGAERVQGHPEERVEGAEEHRHLEHDHDVRRDGPDGFTAHQNRPRSE